MKLFAAVCALFVLATPCLGADDNPATLTELKGQVWKRGFVDWKREIWNEPTTAAQGDKLSEGMQLATGDRSWAELTWPYIVTRAWADSVYTIAPNQRLVYLLGGEMLYHLDKHRKDKQPYIVWTKLIQARMRGTTVLFQSRPGLSRMTVLEGCVEVLNRTDGSLVRVQPGLVYEVKEVGEMKDAGVKESASVQSSSSSLLPISMTAAGAKTDLFETSKTVTSLSVADVNELLNHPLLKDFANELPSRQLVETALQSSATTIAKALPKAAGGISKLFSEATILRVPTKLGYRIGPLIGATLRLPDSAAIFTPKGTIGADTASGVDRTLKETANGTAIPGLNNLALPGAGGVQPATGITQTTLPTSFGSSLQGQQSITGGASFGASSANSMQTQVNSVLNSTLSRTTLPGH